jgi:hypothetical protein
MVYELTDREVSDLHNARVYLLYAIEQGEEMFREDSSFMQNMKRSMKYLEPIATRVTKIQDDIREDKWEHSQRIAKLNDFKYSIWSIYEIESYDDTSSVPPGSKLISYYSGRDISVTVEGSTWLDLWKATERLIGMTESIHGGHIFIESFNKVKDSEDVYEVSLGS